MGTNPLKAKAPNKERLKTPIRLKMEPPKPPAPNSIPQLTAAAKGMTPPPPAVTQAAAAAQRALTPQAAEVPRTTLPVRTAQAPTTQLMPPDDNCDKERQELSVMLDHILTTASSPPIPGSPPGHYLSFDPLWELLDKCHSNRRSEIVAWLFINIL